MQIVTNFPARRAHNLLAIRTAQSCSVAQLFLLCYSQATILVSVTHFAVGAACSNIYTMIRTFVSFHSSVAFVLNYNTSPLLVGNAACITAEVTFFAITRYQLSYSDIVRSFVSIPIQSNPIPWLSNAIPKSIWKSWRPIFLLAYFFHSFLAIPKLTQ